MSKLLTIKETSKYLNVSQDTLRRWDKSGKLKSLKTSGGHRRYSTDDLNDYIGLKKDKDVLLDYQEKLKLYQDAINFSIDNKTIKIEIALDMLKLTK